MQISCLVHDINACDGVGGPIKRKAAKADLQAVTPRHLLNPKTCFSGAHPTYIENVTFFLYH